MTVIGEADALIKGDTGSRASTLLQAHQKRQKISIARSSTIAKCRTTSKGNSGWSPDERRRVTDFRRCDHIAAATNATSRPWLIAAAGAAAVLVDRPINWPVTPPGADDSGAWTVSA